MKYKIDTIKKKENIIIFNGWVVGKTATSPVSYKVTQENGEAIEAKIISIRRDDVCEHFFNEIVDKDFGYDISFEYDANKTYFIVIEVDGKVQKIKIDEKFVQNKLSLKRKQLERILSMFNRKSIAEGFEYLKNNGLSSLIKKIRYKILNIESKYEYSEWYELTKPTKAILEEQRKEKFAYEPLFSIIIPAFETPERYLRDLIESIQTQTYKNFEVCFADGSRLGKSNEVIYKEYATKDNRIKYKILGENKGIAGNTNEALSMASGDYIVLCDHDDVLPEFALYECVKAINETKCDVLYSDEDKMDMETDELFEPHFKPDFNIDLLRSVNYICHLFVVKKDLVEKYGGFRAEFDGAQDYDFIFRMTEKANKIVHIPKVLYHWRCHMKSTAINPESKLYAYEAGARAIEEHYKRALPDIKVEKVEKGAYYGIYHTIFAPEEKLVSVIIPNKDHTADLDKAIRSVYTKSTYKNLEFIVVENNSTLPETWEYYEKIQKEFSNVRVVKWDREFNYSAINNFGVTFAKGEYLLFLNNDVELIEPDSIKEMVSYIQREDVGICGARLLYEDDTIQHAGVVIGFGGIAGHTFIGLEKERISYFNRALITQDYSAVTAACMMSKKSVFEDVAGFSEDLAVAFNDIDYCMKVRKLGKLVVYNPYVCLYHYESKSRGLEDTPEKIERFNREIATFLKKWSNIVNKGDPYYNPNLTLRKSDFSLRDLSKEKIGEPYKIKDIEKYM